ncbi:hypothetical protein [Youngiibacter multivorans]|uniref:Uncharacterized protein n=1 Tax=Youngiibacter multivorans TaxID=937251 RepID=A0ABS4G0D9_9CLOT|nr:hypothetical protein [Youngiibacter multivorans]MBP1918001.1 hypothetical protein [Youngiibacter multivorans]
MKKPIYKKWWFWLIIGGMLVDSISLYCLLNWKKKQDAEKTDAEKTEEDNPDEEKCCKGLFSCRS